MICSLCALTFRFLYFVQFVPSLWLKQAIMFFIKEVLSRQFVSKIDISVSDSIIYRTSPGVYKRS